MRFKDKYKKNSDKDKDSDLEKTIISDDAYAICEQIVEGFEKLRLIRFR